MRSDNALASNICKSFLIFFNLISELNNITHENVCHPWNTVGTVNLNSDKTNWNDTNYQILNDNEDC